MKKAILIVSGVSFAILFLIAGISFFLNNPVKPAITIEAGEKPEQADFYKSPKIYGFLLRNKIPLINCKMVTKLGNKLVRPGEYSVQFLVNGGIRTTKLVVKDTKKPKIILKDVIIAKGEKVSKADFIKKIIDATKIKTKLDCKYKGKPGKYNVAITATDLGKNTSTVKTALYVLNIKRKLEVELGQKIVLTDFLREGEKNIKLSCTKNLDIKKTGEYILPTKVEFDGTEGEIDLILKLVDTKPPKIKGIRDIEVFIGDNISYRDGVYAIDAQGEVPVKVDATAVNLKKEGIYNVTYKAVDRVGNEAIKNIKVKVKKSGSHAKDVSKYVKDILKGTENLSTLKKLEKIYEFCHDIRYIGYSDKSNITEAAYNGFKTGRGDCFTYFSTAKVLMDAIGLENKMIQRNGRSDHFWNLVKYNDKWYHFDACPLAGKEDFKTFMLGNSELLKFSKSYGEKYPEHRDYYKFNIGLYPKIAETGVK